MNRDDFLRPSSAVATQTALQSAVVRFDSVLADATFTLDERQFEVFLDVAARRIAAEYVRLLEGQWRAA
jgi:hypothetical protein